MDVAVRPAATDELPAILELWETSGAEPTHTDDVASLTRLLAHDPGALLVATAGEQIIGTVIAGFDGWRGGIYRLVVTPAHRRRGLAHRLLAAAEDHLRAQGAVRLAAIVVDDDAQAMEFWTSTGWQLQTARARFVKG